jgi:hypothetical protein
VVFDIDFFDIKQGADALLAASRRVSVAAGLAQRAFLAALLLPVLLATRP